MSHVKEIETEITIVTTTGTTLKYKYKREDGSTVITRTITTSGQSTATTSIDDIRHDADQLRAVAKAFEDIDKYK